MTIAVEYVSEEDTLAIITIKETQSASLRTTNAILISGLLIASYFLNVLFIVAVLITKSFRTPIYLMYGHLTLINLIDLSFNILFALIYVANGTWNMSNGWCTFNVAVQQFAHLHTLFVLMLIGVERAMGMILGADYLSKGHRYFSEGKIVGASVLLTAVSLMYASVVFLNVVPTKPFRNRYVCGIDSGGPIGYVISRIIIYIACLVIILIAIGAILKKRTAASIPRNTQEYAEFIKRNRAMQEHKSRAKLMILISCVFIFIEGPYITLCFFYEMYNSKEFGDASMDIPQDADTLITWLKFIFPLLCPIIILSWCNDIWLKVKEVMCCKSYDPPTIGHFMPEFRGGINVNGDISPVPSVMTIVESDNGSKFIEPPVRNYIGHGIITASTSTSDNFSGSEAASIVREESLVKTSSPPKIRGKSRIPKRKVEKPKERENSAHRNVPRIRRKQYADENNQNK